MPNRSDNLANRAHAKGERNTTPTHQIGADIRSVVMSIDRSLLANIPDRDVCQVMLERSRNQQEWEASGGISFRGGDHIGRNGLVIPFSQFAIEVPPGYRFFRAVIDAKEDSFVKVDLDQFVTIVTHGG